MDDILDDDIDTSMDDLFDLNFLGVKKSRAHTAYAALPDEVSVSIIVNRHISPYLHLNINEDLLREATIHKVQNIVQKYEGQSFCSCDRATYAYSGFYDRRTGQTVTEQSQLQTSDIPHLFVRKKGYISVDEHFKNLKEQVFIPRRHRPSPESLLRLHQLMLVMGMPPDSVSVVDSRHRMQRQFDDHRYDLTQYLRSHPLSVSTVDDLITIQDLVSNVLEMSNENAVKVMRYLASLRKQSEGGPIESVKTLAEVLR